MLSEKKKEKMQVYNRFRFVFVLDLSALVVCKAPLSLQRDDGKLRAFARVPVRAAGPRDPVTYYASRSYTP